MPGAPSQQAQAGLCGCQMSASMRFNTVRSESAVVIPTVTSACRSP